MTNQRAFGRLFSASIKEFVREPTGLSIAVMLPLMFVFFFGFAYRDQTLPPENGAVAVRQIDFVVPGVLGLGIMWLGVFAAIPLAAQRELGVLRRFAVAPVSRSVLVAAQVASRLVVSLAQAMLVLVAGRLFFGVPFSTAGPMIAVVLLGALAFVTLGYAIAAVAPTQPAAHGLAQVISMPMVFLAGVFFPIAAMPGFLQPLIWALPLTYLADALRQVALGGAVGAFPLALDLAILAAWTIVLGAVAVRWFRWT